MQNEMRVGKIIPMRNGLYMTWVQCPLATAIRLANIRRIQIGWASIRIEIMEQKPVQCYKCWGFGHVRTNCKSDKTRLGCCFKCGSREHMAHQCENTV